MKNLTQNDDATYRHPVEFQTTRVYYLEISRVLRTGTWLILLLLCCTMHIRKPGTIATRIVSGVQKESDVHVQRHRRLRRRPANRPSSAFTRIALAVSSSSKQGLLRPLPLLPVVVVVAIVSSPSLRVLLPGVLL